MSPANTPQNYFQNALENIEAAKDEADLGWLARALSTSYYAAFYAANAALLLEGFHSKRHSAIVGRFGYELVKNSDFPPKIASILGRLQTSRISADYDMVFRSSVSEEDVACQLRESERFVQEVGSWIRRHHSDVL